MRSIISFNHLLVLLQETLKELFPCWEAVQRYREVVIFVAGLMKDSRPLVQFVYAMQVEYYLNEMRTGGAPDIDADLFKWIHTESAVRLFDHPLHNKCINYYDHQWDKYMERPFDTTVYFPSRIYHFEWMKEDVVLGEYNKQGAEIPECAINIYHSDERVSKSLLSKCRKISEHQAVTDLSMFMVFMVDCDDVTEAEAPILNRNIQSLYIGNFNISPIFMRIMLQQLHNCITLTNLELHGMYLRKVEEDLDQLMDNLVSNHEKGLSQKKLRILIERNVLSKEFATKWNERCEGITSIGCKIY